jgi:hypothetical protein
VDCFSALAEVMDRNKKSPLQIGLTPESERDKKSILFAFQMA